MSDFASIMGGAPDSMLGRTVPPDEVAPDWDAYYSIQSENVFLDRFDTSGASVVDARGNYSGVRVEAGSGADTIHGGTGNDIIQAGAGNDVVLGGGEINHASMIAKLIGDRLFAFASGGDLFGAFGSSPILASAGHNPRAVWGGNDIIGDSGWGRLQASASDGIVSGGSETNHLSAIAKLIGDRLFAVTYGNALFDAGDNNGISGDAGRDLLVGGRGKDTISGGMDQDTIRSGAGDDHITGGSGADSIRGGCGNDSMFGDSDDDFLHGEDGSDMLDGGGGRDELTGGAGNDILAGGSGGAVFAFDTGFGRDVISDFRGGDQINLAADLNGTGIASPHDLVAMGMVSGGITAAGAKFTVLTIGTDTIRLEKVDHTDFINQIGTWVHVG